MTPHVYREFKLHDEHNLVMHIHIGIGQLTPTYDMTIHFQYRDGTVCGWAGEVERFIKQGSVDEISIGYSSDMNYDDFKRGIKYVDLAHKVAQLPIDTILKKRKEINGLILDMLYPN